MAEADLKEYRQMQADLLRRLEQGPDDAVTEQLRQLKVAFDAGCTWWIRLGRQAGD